MDIFSPMLHKNRAFISKVVLNLNTTYISALLLHMLYHSYPHLMRCYAKVSAKQTPLHNNT